MEETYTVSAYGFRTERVEALSPDHAAELYADMFRMHDGMIVDVQNEGTFIIRVRTEHYAVRKS